MNSNSLPKQLIVINPAGAICGIARAAGSWKSLDPLVYGHRHPVSQFLGYILNYDPDVKYIARSADGTTSDEAITIENSKLQ
jgi:hypothetical protein